MVWGVCRRVLRNHHDAEDAFQATFLVLVRKAASIAPREMVANWLYGVAHQTALKARATAAKRRARERQVTDDARTEPAPDKTCGTTCEPLLDQELSRLPDKYRVRHRPVRPGGQDPQGGGPATRRARRDGGESAGEGEGDAGEAAHPARAVALSGGSLAAVLSQKVGVGVRADPVGSVPRSRRASLFAAGEAATAGVISAKVAALTEE